MSAQMFHFNLTVITEYSQRLANINQRFHCLVSSTLHGVRKQKVHGFLYITLTNLSIFSQLLARIILISQFTENL